MARFPLEPDEAEVIVHQDADGTLRFEQTRPGDWVRCSVVMVRQWVDERNTHLADLRLILSWFDPITLAEARRDPDVERIIRKAVG